MYNVYCCVVLQRMRGWCVRARWLLVLVGWGALLVLALPLLAPPPARPRTRVPARLLLQSEPQPSTPPASTPLLPATGLFPSIYRIPYLQLF